MTAPDSPAETPAERRAREWDEAVDRKIAELIAVAPPLPADAQSFIRRVVAPLVRQQRESA